LRRSGNRAKGLATDAEVAEIVDALAGICVPVIFDYSWRPTGAHADDELVIETAINGQADAIAKFNLLTHFPQLIFTDRCGLLRHRPRPA
jgi:hypothetical protein